MQEVVVTVKVNEQGIFISSPDNDMEMPEMLHWLEVAKYAAMQSMFNSTIQQIAETNNLVVEETEE